MEWFDKYIGPSYGNSTCEVGNKKPFLNSDIMSSLECETMTEVCDTQNNMDCGTTNHPNKTYGEDIIYENIPPLSGYNVHQLLPDNVVRIDSKLIQGRNVENVSSMEFIKSEGDELEEGELKIGNLQLPTNCRFTGYRPNIVTMSEEPNVDVADMSARPKPHCVTITKDSNQDVHCKFVKIESVEPQVTEGSDVDVICRSTQTKSNCLPVSGEAEVDTNSKSTESNIHTLPVSEESDVDLLYSYYTCVSPERREDKLFKEIKSEPWIEVSQLQGILPGERVKVQDDASMTQSPTKYGRKVIKKEYITIPDLLETEPNSRKDILCIPNGNPDHTSSSSPFLGQVNDCNFSPLKLINARASYETNNATWQPVVILENIGESIPRHSCFNQERPFSPKKRKRGPENNQSCKTRVDRPVHGDVFPTNISTCDIQPVSTDIFSEDKAGRITENYVEKGHNSPTPVTEKRVTVPDIGINAMDDNGTPDKPSSSVSKIDTLTTKICIPSPTVSDIRLTDVELGDDVATGSQDGCRPKRQSAVKAVEKLQETMEVDDGDTSLDEIIDSEDSDYEESDVSASDDEINVNDGSNSDVSASDDEIDVNDGSNSSNPSQTLVMNTKRNAQPLKCTSCPKTFCDKRKLTKHQYCCHRKEVITDFFCDKCKRYFQHDGFLKRHNLSKHGKLPENTKPQKCIHCAAEFLDDGSLKQHMYKLHNKKLKTDFFCAVCGRYFRDDAALKMHNLSTHRKVPGNTQAIWCTYCPKTFCDKRKLTKHQYCCHRKELKTDFFCAECEQYFQNKKVLTTHSFKMHGKLPKNTKLIKCNLCQSQFWNQNSLNQHLYCKHSTKKLKTDFFCAVCGRYFLNDATLKAHNLSTHRKVPEGTTDFFCAACEQYFQHDGFLKRHNFSIHGKLPKNTKPQKCTYCAAEFLDEANLKDHLSKLHKKELKTDFFCAVCERCFRSDAALKRHHFSMHRKVPENFKLIKCTFCPNEFWNKDSLNQHRRSKHSTKVHAPKPRGNFGMRVDSNQHDRYHHGEGKTKPIKCTCCPKTFCHKRKLTRHQYRCHRKELKTDFFCAECEQYFLNKRILKTHSFKMHGKLPENTKLIKCNLCPNEFWNRPSLNCHLRTKHSTKGITDFFCSACEQYFPHDGFLKRHNFSMHGKLPENTKPLKCTTCAAEFLHKENLRRHMSTLHKKILKTELFCAVCERYFRDDAALKMHNLFTHRKVPKNGKTTKCNICAKVCLSEKQLKLHLIHQHNKKDEPMKYRCEICHHQFLLKGMMLRHKQIIHVQERRCVCEVCGQVFKDNAKLSIHMDNHKKRYQCHICSTFCSTTYNLKTHMLSHTGEKPHKCEVCGQAFTRIDNLKLHLKLMHKDVLRYECKKCNKKFKTNKLKQEHQRQEHIAYKGPRLTACKLCGEMLSKVKAGPHEIRHKTGRIMKCEKCETHVTLTNLRYKYKIKDKDEKYQTVCYGCFEEYARQYKPEAYNALSRKCKLPDSCKYCGKSVTVRYLYGHEAKCQIKSNSTDNRTKDAGSNALVDDSSSSENVFEDKNMTLPSMASDQGSIADIQGTHSSSSEIV